VGTNGCATDRWLRGVAGAAQRAVRRRLEPDLHHQPADTLEAATAGVPPHRRDQQPGDALTVFAPLEPGAHRDLGLEPGAVEEAGIGCSGAGALEPGADLRGGSHTDALGERFGLHALDLDAGEAHVRGQAQALGDHRQIGAADAVLRQPTLAAHRDPAGRRLEPQAGGLVAILAGDGRRRAREPGQREAQEQRDDHGATRWLHRALLRARSGGMRATGPAPV